MTQHNTLTTFTTPKGVKLEVDVLMGWDEPLQRHFLVVEVLDFDIEVTEDDIPESLRQTSDVDEGIVYSNLLDNAEGKGLKYFENKLIELGIKVPESMIVACKSGEGVDPQTGSLFHAFPEDEQSN
jgi:hypothetical protein